MLTACCLRDISRNGGDHLPVPTVLRPTVLLSFIYYKLIYQQNCTLFYFIKKQHIKILVLFKSPNNSPTCFGQSLTILREIFIFFTSVTKDKIFRFVEACL